MGGEGCVGPKGTSLLLFEATLAARPLCDASSEGLAAAGAPSFSPTTPDACAGEAWARAAPSPWLDVARGRDCKEKVSCVGGTSSIAGRFSWPDSRVVAASAAVASSVRVRGRVGGVSGGGGDALWIFSDASSEGLDVRGAAASSAAASPFRLTTADACAGESWKTVASSAAAFSLRPTGDACAGESWETVASPPWLDVFGGKAVSCAGGAAGVLKSSAIFSRASGPGGADGACEGG